MIVAVRRVAAYLCTYQSVVIRVIRVITCVTALCGTVLYTDAVSVLTNFKIKIG